MRERESILPPQQSKVSQLSAVDRGNRHRGLAVLVDLRRGANMLHCTRTTLRTPVSKVHVREGLHYVGKGYGRSYNGKAIRQNANSGWGISTYSAGKDRRYQYARAPHKPHAPDAPANMPISNVTKNLSHEWRPFALNDGGVLFIHPTRDQVLKWSEEVMKRERASAGMSTRDHDTSAKIQTLIADNTLEHISLTTWRRTQLYNLLRRQSGVKRSSGVVS